jgi:hypothetical protein
MFKNGGVGCLKRGSRSPMFKNGVGCLKTEGSESDV